MMRVWPCELPWVWPRGNCSKPRTRAPRWTSLQAAALPMPPSPTTITSALLIAALLYTTKRRAVGVCPLVSAYKGAPFCGHGGRADDKMEVVGGGTTHLHPSG